MGPDLGQVARFSHGALATSNAMSLILGDFSEEKILLRHIVPMWLSINPCQDKILHIFKKAFKLFVNFLIYRKP